MREPAFRSPFLGILSPFPSIVPNYLSSSPFPPSLLATHRSSGGGADRRARPDDLRGGLRAAAQPLGAALACSSPSPLRIRRARAPPRSLHPAAATSLPGRQSPPPPRRPDPPPPRPPPPPPPRTVGSSASSTGATSTYRSGTARGPSLCWPASPPAPVVLSPLGRLSSCSPGNTGTRR